MGDEERMQWMMDRNHRMKMKMRMVLKWAKQVMVERQRALDGVELRVEMPLERIRGYWEMVVEKGGRRRRGTDGVRLSLRCKSR